MAALLLGRVSDGFRLLTGLAGDAFPSRCCELSSDAYPAFSLQPPGLAERRASEVRDVIRKVRVSDPRGRSETVGLSTGGLPVVRPADGRRDRGDRANHTTKRRGTRLD